MNVLVVAPHFPPSHVGGVEAYAKSLADQLTAFGHRVEAAAVEEVASAAEDACDARTDADGGYPIHRLRLTLRRGRSFPLLWEHGAAQAWLEQVIRRFAPDIVHVQSGYLLGGAALAAARRAATPSVVTLHDYWFACPRITLLRPGGELCSGPEGIGKCAWCLRSDRRRYRVLPRALRARLAARTSKAGRGRALDRHSAAVAGRLEGVIEALQTAAAILSPTRFVAEQIARAGVPLARIRIDPFGFARPPRVERSPAGKGLRLAYLGQIAPHKGVEIAVQAVRANADPALGLAVFGPRAPHREYAARVERLARGDPRIVFHDAYSHDDLPAILAATDASVVPSTWYENAPLVIKEAHAAGVPVLASRVGGIPELVTHERDGLLFEPGRADDLGRQIVRLQTEPGLLARLAAGTRPPLSIEDHVQGLVALYNEARLRA
jgi:glycosyltransferase involved in cell wall biosynthesis